MYLFRKCKILFQQNKRKECKGSQNNLTRNINSNMNKNTILRGKSTKSYVSLEMGITK